MNQPSCTGKRIVSKGEYIQAQGHRIIILGIGMGATALMLGCGLATMGLTLVFIMCLREWRSIGNFEGFLFLCEPVIGIGIFGFGIIFFGRLLKRAVKEVHTIDPGTPHTRANTADLPAPESLVRASEESKQEQKTVLLRGATQEKETPLEQLVRPSERQKPL